MRVLGKIKAYAGRRLIGRSLKGLYHIRATAIPIALFVHPTLVAGLFGRGGKPDSLEFAHAEMKMETRSARSGRIQDDQ